MTLLLNPRTWLALGLAALLAFTHLTVYRAGRHAVRSAWDAANVASERVAQEQVQRMRDLQRAAELRYTVEAQTRDRFIVTTVKEIHDATASLAACPLPDAARRLFNAAGACADPAATCGAGDAVRPSR